ncbi:integrin-linked protein kinase-like isoform X1 [Biomphalaria glabrata]|uniref:Integrin-linked protein kinase-like isoform X1 n=1 Tax=Biomphalaria glabrata TaxID=6526 RepID=A0A2C9JR92_BIOGL|nr:integrin-linked protein kinase-like isoform X1 [Biomphalaria glabrata]KAI8798917.1 integrin-linked protein kinase isoform X1 [Biomphalaria glabrata]
MDDIFSQVREGNAFNVRVWLDNTENDLNKGDDHRFSLLHWAAREGRDNVVEMLIKRGARINATNMGDDTPIHLAAAHGHREVVIMLLQNKANVNAINEHGNTPLHYACFWGFEQIAEDLVNYGALVSIANKFGDVPLDKCKPYLAKILKDRAVTLGQDLSRIPFKDRSWLGYKTRSRDAILSRHTGIDIKELQLVGHIAKTHSGENWRGTWQGNEIVAKILSMKSISDRNIRDFKEELPKLRIFNHPNVLAVLGCCVPKDIPDLVVISQFMPFGSLYNTLHGESGIVVDQNQALRFAIDIARGMEFLHSMEPLIPNFILTSKHVMIDEDLAKINVDDPKYTSGDPTLNGIDEDLTAKINMADYKFSFHEKGKLFSPAWCAPEALQRAPEDINVRAADMWSFAILLWELETREVPFAELEPMEIGMKVALEDLRISIPPGISNHMNRLIKICMNEEPGKRPKFDMVIPILEKMKLSS